MGKLPMLLKKHKNETIIRQGTKTTPTILCLSALINSLINILMTFIIVRSVVQYHTNRTLGLLWTERFNCANGKQFYLLFWSRF